MVQVRSGMDTTLILLFFNYIRGVKRFVGFRRPLGNLEAIGCSLQRPSP